MSGLCLVFANLKARNIGGIPSDGMVMCACSSDKSKIVLMRPPEGSKVGDRISLDGF